jgi:hypothetical protein
MKNIQRRLAVWAIIIVAVLLVPLVAMQFTNEVVWTLGDFIIAGCLLFGSAVIYELATRRITDSKRRIIIGAVVLTGLLYFWAELAVGIFTNWGN